MKTIIAGSRGINTIALVYKAVKDSQFIITEVVSGGARGVDSLAIQYAKEEDIPYTVMKADWDKFGKSAGFRRNAEMANYAEALVAIWDGESRGTMHMINLAKERKLKVFVHFLGDPL